MNKYHFFFTIYYQQTNLSIQYFRGDQHWAFLSQVSYRLASISRLFINEKFMSLLGLVINKKSCLIQKSFLEFFNYLTLGWSYECLFDWKVYLKLGITGFGFVIFEYMNFEVATFLSGAFHKILSVMLFFSEL
jgi:hypothetical protein